MRPTRRCAAVLSLLLALGSGTVFASIGDDGTLGHLIRKDKTHRSLIQRVLNYLDNKISLPPG